MKPGWLVATGQNRPWSSANSASMPGTILKRDSSTVSTFFSAGVGAIGVSFLVSGVALMRGSAIIVELLDCNRQGLRAMLMNVGGGRAVDQQAEQLRAAVVAARIHLPLPLVDQSEIEIGDHHAFAGTQRLTHQYAFGGDDRGEAAAG